MVGFLENDTFLGGESAMVEIWVPIVTTIIAGVFSVISTSIARIQISKANNRAKIAEDNERIAQNIFGSRENVDGSIPLEERIGLELGIKEIRILNLSSNTVLNPEIVDVSIKEKHNELSRRIEKLVVQEKIKLVMVIAAPDSEAAKEAVRTEKVINTRIHRNKRELVFYSAYAAIQEKIAQDGVFQDSYEKGRFVYRLTEDVLPYAIFQVKYEDSRKNHIKLDLYSPYIGGEKDRRTIYLYENKRSDDYRFFSENFDRIYNHAMSEEEELEKREEWLEKNKVLSAKN